MVKLTPLKILRMNLGLRQLDIARGTGIHPSRLSLIENELVLPSERESELIQRFLAQAAETIKSVGDAAPQRRR